MSEESTLLVKSTKVLWRRRVSDGAVFPRQGQDSDTYPQRWNSFSPRRTPCGAAHELARLDFLDHGVNPAISRTPLLPSSSRLRRSDGPRIGQKLTFTFTAWDFRGRPSCDVPVPGAHLVTDVPGFPGSGKRVYTAPAVYQ